MSVDYLQRALPQLPAHSCPLPTRNRTGTTVRPTAMTTLRQISALTIPPARISSAQFWFGPKLYWLAQIAVWGLVVGSADIVVGIISNGCFRWTAVLSSFCFSLEMIVGTHLSRWVILSRRRTSRSVGQLMLAAIGCIPLCALATSAVGLVLGFLFRNVDDLPLSERLGYALPLLYFGATYSVFWLAAYTSWTFLDAYHSAEEARLRSESLAKDAELIAIKAQINPHFLFNSLNTLRALVPREHDVPREAITKLADLLRAALTVQANSTIPLRKEFETVDAYLALEQLRFEERLQVHREIAPDSLDQPIPPFALQTLVENAVKFGIGSRAEGGEIRISIVPQPSHLQLRVSNPGRIATDSSSTGLGLRNTRRRLTHLYGDKARLDLTQSEPDRVTAELQLPIAPA